MGLRTRVARRGEVRSTIDLSALAKMWQNTLPYSPISVSVSTAVTNAAVSAVVDALATSVSSLPIDVVRPQGDRRIPVTPTPSLIVEPSGLVEQDVWMYQVMDSTLTDGNAFGEITGYARQLPAQIETVDAALVTDRRVIDGRKSALVAGERRFCWPHGDLWHMPGRFTRAGNPFAESPIDRARATVGAAIAAREFGARFFGDGGHPGGIITSDADITAEQAEVIKRAWLNATRGNREPAVLGGDLTYHPLLVDPNDSQFIDLMRFAIEEACRFWRVPPSMVYAATSGQSVTYANVSQADLAYLKHSLEGHLVRIEKALTRLLPRPHVVRFNRNAFLRSDPTTRSEIIDRRLRNKTLSVNEAKALEDEQPYGDEFNEPGIPGSTEPAPDPLEDPDA